MSKRRGLGRGIDAFITDKNKIEDILKPANSGEVKELPLDEIIRNENQPRKEFDKAALNELAQSIAEFGVIQPIIVRKTDTGYVIVAGERRFRASQLAGLEKIPVIIREFEDLDYEKVAIIENVQRVDLNPIDEAHAYKSIIDNYSITQEELAKTIGKSRPYVSNTMRLLKLDPRVLEMLRTGQLSPSMGKVLLSIKDEKEQYKKALSILKSGESVHDASGGKKNRKTGKSKSNQNIYYREIEESFLNRLGTKVNIDDKKKVISINYYDEDDLQRLIEIIIGE